MLAFLRRPAISGFFLPLLGMLLFFGGFTLSLYRAKSNNVLETLRATQGQRARGIARGLRHEVSDAVSDLRAMAGAKGIERFLAGQGTFSHDLDRLFRGFISAKKIYAAIFVVDLRSEKVWGVRVAREGAEEFSGKSGQVWKDTYIGFDLASVLKLMEGQVLITSTRMASGPVLRLALPLRNPVSGKQGMLAVDFLAEHLFQYLDRRTDFLVGRDAAVVFGGEPSEQGTFASRYPRDWQEVLENDAGQYLSAAGLHTFETVYPAEDEILNEIGPRIRAPFENFHWKVVSRIGPGMLLRDLEVLRSSLIRMFAACVLISTLFAAVFYRWRRQKADKQRLYFEILETGRLASLGTLAGGVAREIRHPLARIQGFNHLLRERARDGGQSAELLTLLEKQELAIEGLVAVADGLGAVARMDSAQTTTVDLHQVVRDTVGLLDGTHRNLGIQVELTLASVSAKVVGNPGKLQQVFVHLLSNAASALRDRPGPRRISIQTWNLGGWLVCAVRDNGTEFPKEHLGKVFDAFFTEEVKREAGLSLSICQSIVQAMGGSIKVQSHPGEETSFQLELPCLSV